MSWSEVVTISQEVGGTSYERGEGGGGGVFDDYTVLRVVLIYVRGCAVNRFGPFP